MRQFVNDTLTPNGLSWARSSTRPTRVPASRRPSSCAQAGLREQSGRAHLSIWVRVSLTTGALHSRCHSDLRGFERRNLFRMRQFYDAYKDPKLQRHWYDMSAGAATSSLLSRL